MEFTGARLMPEGALTSFTVYGPFRYFAGQT